MTSKPLALLISKHSTMWLGFGGSVGSPEPSAYQSDATCGRHETIHFLWRWRLWEVELPTSGDQLTTLFHVYRTYIIFPIEEAHVYTFETCLKCGYAFGGDSNSTPFANDRHPYIEAKCTKRGTVCIRQTATQSIRYNLL